MAVVDQVTTVNHSRIAKLAFVIHSFISSRFPRKSLSPCITYSVSIESSSAPLFPKRRGQLIREQEITIPFFGGYRFRVARLSQECYNIVEDYRDELRRLIVSFVVR